VAIGTTISCSLGKWYGPVLSLSFLDVYVSMSTYFGPYPWVWEFEVEALSQQGIGF
jgi:hypothetical protein